VTDAIIVLQRCDEEAKLAVFADFSPTQMLWISGGCRAMWEGLFPNREQHHVLQGACLMKSSQFIRQGKSEHLLFDAMHRVEHNTLRCIVLIMPAIHECVTTSLVFGYYLQSRACKATEPDA